jgi:hypothetical protein
LGRYSRQLDAENPVEPLKASLIKNTLLVKNIYT